MCIRDREYAIRKTSVDRLGVPYYKSIKIAAYADDIAIITRASAAARETYLNLKISIKDVGLTINMDKTKMISQKGLRDPGKIRL